MTFVWKHWFFFTSTISIFFFTIYYFIFLFFHVCNGNANWLQFAFVLCMSRPFYICIDIPLSRPLVLKLVLSLAGYTGILVLSREVAPVNERTYPPPVAWAEVCRVGDWFFRIFTIVVTIGFAIVVVLLRVIIIILLLYIISSDVYILYTIVGGHTHISARERVMRMTRMGSYCWGNSCVTRPDGVYNHLINAD